MTSTPPFEMEDSDRMMAAVDLFRRCGAVDFQLRYQDDEQPLVWMAVVRTQNGAECDAAFSPERAVLRLAERMVDGGMCTHCHRPTGLDPDGMDVMPFDKGVCWYQFDPELKTFRRGCEGDVP